MRWRSGVIQSTIYRQLQGTISPEVYQRSAQVKQLSREGSAPGDPEKVLRLYNFEGIYPNTVSSIPLDFGATDQIEEFQVTFKLPYSTKYPHQQVTSS